jgi:hypothetical protein
MLIHRATPQSCASGSSIAGNVCECKGDTAEASERDILFRWFTESLCAKEWRESAMSAKIGNSLTAFLKIRKLRI